MEECFLRWSESVGWTEGECQPGAWGSSADFNFMGRHVRAVFGDKTSGQALILKVTQGSASGVKQGPITPVGYDNNLFRI